MPVRKMSTKEILDRNLSRKSPGQLSQLKMVLHDVRSMHNVGAAFRSADAFGIGEIVISGFTPAPPRPEISKTAIGAEKHVDWRQVDDIADELHSMKEAGYHILGLEQTTDSTPLPDFQLPKDRNICLLLGNEVTGVEESLLDLVDNFIEIPQYGHKHSLNVSVAAGVALYGILEKYWTA